MNICSGGKGVKQHREIIHDEGMNDCPFCAFMEDAAGEIADLNAEIKDRDEQILRLEQEAQ